MIKLFCDRCMSEIHGNGYNVKISEDHGMNALYNYLTAESISSASFNSLSGGENIYCKDCIDEIQHCINTKVTRHRPFQE